MKASLAFTVGLWTGALAMTAAGLFYVQGWDRGHVTAAPMAPDQAEARLQLSQQRLAAATAEAERLRQTVAELDSRLAAQTGPLPPGTPNSSPRLTRRVPFRPSGSGEIPSWIVQSVLIGNPQASPKLEQAAAQNDLNALDALALLADRDNAEALTRVWLATGLSDAIRTRATMLLAATVEVNPRGADLLLSLVTEETPNDSLVVAALMGLETPGFSTRLSANPGITPPPHFKPDFGLRLRILDDLRDVVTDGALSVSIDRARERLVRRASDTASVSP